MKAKTAVLISLGIIAAGTASWLLFFRTRNTLTSADRKGLYDYVPKYVETDEDNPNASSTDPMPSEDDWAAYYANYGK